MNRSLLFILGITVLIVSEILRVYFIMPFPGSQRNETIDLAYFLHTNIHYLRIAGILLIAYPVLSFFRTGSLWSKLIVTFFAILYLVIFYFFNFRFLAEKMFYQPEHKVFADAASSKIPVTDLVIGVFREGEAKAYPIEIIGYHHQVRDTVGNTPVMITYCTVCRTGRVFRPAVEGKPENFRLVGMDHFNAMFEDATTGSWWRQVNGEAVTGTLKGKMLEEIAAEQMRLDAWIQQHPNTQIMQPDSTFAESYAHLKNYDEGKGKSELTGTDSLSWHEKSWVVGVQLGKQARAYDWNDLLTRRVLQDTLNATPLLLAMESDSVSFHVWARDSLSFEYDPAAATLRDAQTKSSWNLKGECTDGILKGRRLPVVQSYQEFWHSWRTFRPQTTAYKVAP